MLEGRSVKTCTRNNKSNKKKKKKQQNTLDVRRAHELHCNSVAPALTRHKKKKQNRINQKIWEAETGIPTAGCIY